MKDIVSTRDFLDMLPQAQNLYFHLRIWANEVGMIKNPEKLFEILGRAYNEEALNILLEKEYISVAGNGWILVY